MLKLSRKGLILGFFLAVIGIGYLFLAYARPLFSSSNYADYDPSGNLIITNSSTSNQLSTLRIWDSDNHMQIAQLQNMSTPNQFLFSSNSEFLIRFVPNHDSLLYVYSTQNWEITQTRGYPRPICEVAISQDVIFIMVCSHERNVVYVTNINENTDELLGTPITEFDTISGSGQPTFTVNNSGTKLLIAVNSANETSIELRDIPTYQVIQTFYLQSEILDAAWLGDNYFVIADITNTVVLYESNTFEQIASFNIPFIVSSVDISSDENLLLVGGDGGTILYDLVDMQQLAVLNSTPAVSVRFDAQVTTALIASSEILRPYIEIDISEFSLNRE
ncbi:MAG: hypothetical protein Phog2KO_28160 [Phototrophicaceae bacterium]